MLHEYTVPVDRALYEEYGQIEGNLSLKGIQSIGVYVEDGFTHEGKTWYYMLVVLAPFAIENLAELFPGVKSQWDHNTRERITKGACPPYRTETKDGKLFIKAESESGKVSFRM